VENVFEQIIDIYSERLSLLWELVEAIHPDLDTGTE
jgi:hypothetical protein